MGCNLIGLAPYIFTRSSHMSFTLTLALPIWLGRILLSMKNQYNRLFAHLVPTGTPGALIPVIVIIDTVSNVIRPGSLSIRLAANIVAGHLLLTLLGSQGPNAQGIVLLVLMKVNSLIVFRVSSSMYSSLCIYYSKVIIFKRVENSFF